MRLPYIYHHQGWNRSCSLHSLRISSRLKRKSLDLSSHFVGPLRWDASLVTSSPPISQIEYEETQRLWERKKSREGWISLLGLSDWVPWEKAINWLAMTDKSSLSIYSLEYRISSSIRAQQIPDIDCRPTDLNINPILSKICDAAEWLSGWLLFNFSLVIFLCKESSSAF